MIQISLEKDDIVSTLMATSILLESVFRMENEEGKTSYEESIGEILCGIMLVPKQKKSSSTLFYNLNTSCRTSYKTN